MCRCVDVVDVVDVDVVSAGERGVRWVRCEVLDKEKQEPNIASLGLRVSKGIIYHGLSLNVSCDLSNFYKIDPCGIKDSRVTSVKNLKNLVNKNEVDEVLKRKIKVLFN